MGRVLEDYEILSSKAESGMERESRVKGIHRYLKKSMA